MTNQGNTSFLTILSVFMVLVLLGIYGIVSIHSNQIGKYIKEQLNIVVELSKNASESERQQVITYIEGRAEVLPNSIDIIGKEDALKMMAPEIESSNLVLGDENPFSDAIIFNIGNKYYSADIIENLKSSLLSQAQVTTVFYEEDFFEKAQTNIQRVSFLSFLFGIFLLILASALIFNTIHLSLINDEPKIKTKELVGAKRRYIKMPYLRKAFRIGWVSSLGACIFLGILLFAISNQVPVIKSILNMVHVLIVFVILILIGILIPMVGTHSIVGKYLNNLYTYH